MNFIFWSAGCSLLNAEGFSNSLDVLSGGLEISKLHFLKKIKKFQLYFFLHFWSSKPWIRIRIRIHLKCWIRIQVRLKCWNWIRIQWIRNRKTGNLPWWRVVRGLQNWLDTAGCLLRTSKVDSSHPLELMEFFLRTLSKNNNKNLRHLKDNRRIIREEQLKPAWKASLRTPEKETKDTWTKTKEQLKNNRRTPKKHSRTLEEPLKSNWRTIEEYR